MPAPFPELKRHGQPQPADPAAQGEGKLRQQAFLLPLDKGQYGLGRWIGINLAPLAPDAPQEIGEQQIRRTPPDLQPQEECPIRCQRHRDGRLPDPPALRCAALDQSLLLQRAHDDGDSLGREARRPRDIGFRRAVVSPQKRQHQPFVVCTHRGLVRAAQSDPFVGCPFRQDLRLRHPVLPLGRTGRPDPVEAI